MHACVVGVSGSGKSHLLRKMEQHCYDRGIPTLVFDPISSGYFEGNVVTTVRDLKKALGHPKFRNTVFLLDETPVIVEEDKILASAMARRGRHEGHKYYFAAQRYMDLPPAVRQNITKFWVFRQNYENKKLLEKETTISTDVSMLLPLHYVYSDNFSESLYRMNPENDFNIEKL